MSKHRTTDAWAERWHEAEELGQLRWEHSAPQTER